MRRKKHDEKTVLELLRRNGVVNVDFSNKLLTALKGSTIGIHTWGKIDYLTHYNGWFFRYNGSVSNLNSTNKPSKRKKKSVLEIEE